MINLRYHIVSLTAVFLALGIGVLLGGTYLDKYTVDQLDQSISSAEARIRETSAENDRLRGEIGDSDARDRALLDSATGQLFGDQVVDVPVLVVAVEGTDETHRRNLVRALAGSGADFRGTLTVTGAMAELADDRAVAVAEALELDVETPTAVRGELIDRLGEALAAAGGPPEAPAQPGSPDSTVPADPTPPTDPVPSTAPVDPTSTTLPGGGTDPATPTTTVPDAEPPAEPRVLTVMLEQGLASYEAPTVPSGSGPLLSGRGYRYVFLSGEDPVVPDQTFLVPTLRRMADVGPVPAVVVAPTPVDDDAEPAVTAVRGDAELSRLVSTVDNLDSFNGVVSTILALEEIGRGTRGHYGEARGAAAPLPTGA